MKNISIITCHILLLLLSHTTISARGGWFSSLWDSFTYEITDYTLSQAHAYGHKQLKILYEACSDTISYRIYQRFDQELSRNIKQEYTQSFGAVSRDLIEQKVISALLEFIREYSHAFARQYVSSAKAHSISESMYNNALAHISQHGFSSARSLTPFVSTQLQRAIQHAHIANTTAQVYPSSACCVCMESFSMVTRVYLSPCGHDICTGCAMRWFFGNAHESGHKNCPLCRAVIDKEQLAYALGLHG